MGKISAQEIGKELEAWKQRREKARATGQVGMMYKADGEIKRLEQQLEGLRNKPENSG